MDVDINEINAKCKESLQWCRRGGVSFGVCTFEEGLYVENDITHALCQFMFVPPPFPWLPIIIYGPKLLL